MDVETTYFASDAICQNLCTRDYYNTMFTDDIMINCFYITIAVWSYAQISPDDKLYDTWLLL